VVLAGALKMQDWKTLHQREQENTRHHTAMVENAGLENAGVTKYVFQVGLSRLETKQQ